MSDKDKKKGSGGGGDHEENERDRYTGNADEDDGKKKKRDGGPQATPHFRNEALFRWLLDRFYADEDTPLEQREFPERLELRITEGPKKKRLGPFLRKIHYKQGDKPPTREKIVAMSNEFVALAQDDCNNSKVATTYAVLPYHFTSNDIPYARFLLPMKPSNLDEEDEESQKRSAEELAERMVARLLEHDGMVYEFVGALTDRQDRVAERLEHELKRRDEREDKHYQTVERFMEKNMQLFDVAERALSLEHQRKMDQAWIDLKIKTAERGVELLASLLPIAVMKLTGKELPAANGAVAAPVPVKDSPESLILKRFFETVTEEQSNVAFGIHEKQQDGTWVEKKPGILTLPQAKVLWAVAHLEVGPTELDKLFEGDLEITGTQIAGIQSVFSNDQLMPMFGMILTRRQQVEARKAKAPPPPPAGIPNTQKSDAVG